MRKVINYNGKALEIIATKCTNPFCYYDYKIFELREKKHWWNCGRIEILSGSTIWWTDNDDFETKIMEKIETYYGSKHVDNVENFFNKS